MSDPLGLFGEYSKAEPSVANVNPLTHDVVDVKDSTPVQDIDINPLEMIREIALKHGIELNTPKPKCKSCRGRGVVYIRHPGELVELPKACHCITKDHMKRRASVMEEVQTLHQKKRN